QTCERIRDETRAAEQENRREHSERGAECRGDSHVEIARADGPFASDPIEEHGDNDRYPYKCIYSCNTQRSPGKSADYRGHDDGTRDETIPEHVVGPGLRNEEPARRVGDWLNQRRDAKCGKDVTRLSPLRPEHNAYNPVSSPDQKR